MQRMRFLSTVVLWASIVSALVVPGARVAGAQAQEGFTTRVDVTLIELEVRVEDGDGKFVTGLGPGDFEVREDGQPVELRFVDEVRSGGVHHRDAGRTPLEGTTVGSPGRPAPRQRRPSSLLVVVDTANSGPEGIGRQRSYVRNFLRSLQGANASVALVTLVADGGFRMLSGFDQDLDRAVAAVADVKPGASGAASRRNNLDQLETIIDDKIRSCTIDTGEAQQLCIDNAFDRTLSTARIFAQEERARARQSILSLRRVLGFSDHLPGRRSVVLISEGIDPAGSGYYNAAAQLISYVAQNQGTSGHERWIAEIQREAERYTRELGEFGKIMQAAVASSLTVHWLNPSHSGTLNPFSPEASFGSYSVGTDYVNVADMVGMMRDITVETGGLARIRAARIEDFYRRVADDVRNYYLLTYVPRRLAHDGQKHRLKVEVRRDDVEVRARRSFVDATPQARHARGIATALDFPKAYADSPMVAALNYLRKADGGYVVTVHVAFPYSAITPVIEGETARATLYYGFSVRDEAGRVVEVESPFLHVRMPSAKPSDGEVGAYLNYRENLDLDPGKYTITAAVLDSESGKLGSRRFAVELPDDQAACLKVTPLMLAAETRSSDEPAAGLEFDDRGDARYHDRKLVFAGLRTLPPRGDLSGVFQIVNASAGAESRPDVEVYFRVLHRGALLSKTPPSHVRSFSNPAQGTYTGYFSVPYSRLDAGPYRLEMVARDAISGCSSVSGADFQVASGPRPGADGAGERSN